MVRAGQERILKESPESRSTPGLCVGRQNENLMAGGQILALGIALGLAVAPFCDATPVDCSLLNDAVDVTVGSNVSELQRVCEDLCDVKGLHDGGSQARDENVGLAFGLVAAAGMSTSLGAGLVFCDSVVTHANRFVLASSLGFSGGVMLYVSFVEIFIKAVDEFSSCDCLWEHDDPTSPAKIMTTLMFFVGILSFVLLDLFIHALQHRAIRLRQCKSDKDLSDSRTTTGLNENGNASNASIAIDQGSEEEAGDLMIDDVQSNAEIHCEESKRLEVSGGFGGHGLDPCVLEKHARENFNLEGSHISETEVQQKLSNMGLLTAVAIALHNFPEGLATFVATLADPTVGVGLAVAIAVHNIPEGLCVSIPIFYASGNRLRAFFLATLSGLAELVGAFLGWIALASTLSPIVYGILFGLVAGMMVAIVMKELIPTAHLYDPKDRVTTWSVFVGMFVMAISLCLFLL